MVFRRSLIKYCVCHLSLILINKKNGIAIKLARMKFSIFIVQFLITKSCQLGLNGNFHWPMFS